MTLVWLACVPDFPDRTFDTAPSADTQADTSPLDTAPPDTAPPDTAPPDTAPPATDPPSATRLVADDPCARAGEVVASRVTAGEAFLLVGGPGLLDGSCEQAGQVWELDLAELPASFEDPLELGLSVAGGGALVDLSDGFAVGDPRRDGEGAALIVDASTTVLSGEADVFAEGAALDWDGGHLYVGAPSDSISGGQVVAVTRDSKALSDGETLTADAAESFGRVLAMVGDLGGDGARSLAIGAPDAAGGAGLLFVVETGWADQAAVADVGQVLSGKAGLGSAVATADLDGDGIAQLVVAVDGAVLVLDDLDLGTPLATFSAPGYDGFGASLVLNDLDRDGEPELLVGAPGASVVLRAPADEGVHELDPGHVLLEGDADELGSSLVDIQTKDGAWLVAGAPGAEGHAGAVELLAY